MVVELNALTRSLRVRGLRVKVYSLRVSYRRKKSFDNGDESVLLLYSLRLLPVIGRQGEMINRLQADSAARIQVAPGKFQRFVETSSMYHGCSKSFCSN